MIGRIYKIQSSLDGCFYIGSTRLPIEERLKEHRICRNRRTHDHIPIYAYFNVNGWENAIISLLIEFEDITDEDLLWEERKVIDSSWQVHDVRCLNKNRPIITTDELKDQVRINHQRWNQSNKERAAETLREWRRANPEKVREQRKRQIPVKRDNVKTWDRVKNWRLNNPEKYAEQVRRANECAKEKRASQKTI